MKTEITNTEEEQNESEDLYEKNIIEVSKGQEPLRLDKFLMGRMEGATRNKVQQGILGELVLVNDMTVKPNYKVKPGDKITLIDNREQRDFEIVPEYIPIDIVYEDEDVMVVNKPAGMVVHPGCGNYDGTLINGVAYHLMLQNPELEEQMLPKFGMVHRIDKNTSGLLVLAKTTKAMAHLAKQFYKHTVHRRYIALVWGDFENESGTITGNVGRHQRFRKLFTTYTDSEYGKPAITHYKVLERFNYVSLVECRLETGRTHQIRVHMQHIGHPLFNDDFYGGDKIVKGTVFTKYKQFVENCFGICKRQALHAKELGFIHPSTQKEMMIESPLPKDMETLIEKWRNYSKNRNG
jgi:23S rRNA pseudouridine1911/1915/1917 synthase